MNRPKDERREGNALRERLRAAQGNRCHWCGQEMTDAAWGYPRPPSSVTLDHVEPRCVGGPLSENNCVAACHECNAKRSEEFTQARAPIKSRIDRATNGLRAAEIADRLGRVAARILRNSNREGPGRQRASDNPSRTY